MVGQPKIAPAPASYTKRQIALHWIVFVLVAFQFAIGNQMADLFRAAHGGSPTDVGAIWAPVHIAVGDRYSRQRCCARLVLRRTRRRAGAAEAAPRSASGSRAPCTSGSMSTSSAPPIVGLDRRFLAALAFAGLHRLMTRPILIALFGLHLAGALWHWLVVRDDVMTRIVRPRVSAIGGRAAGNS